LSFNQKNFVKQAIKTLALPNVLSSKDSLYADVPNEIKRSVCAAFNSVLQSDYVTLAKKHSESERTKEEWTNNFRNPLVSYPMPDETRPLFKRCLDIVYGKTGLSLDDAVNYIVGNYPYKVWAHFHALESQDLF
jgi:hypothetical protein